MIESFQNDPFRELQNGVEAGPKYDRLFDEVIRAATPRGAVSVLFRCAPFRNGVQTWYPEDQEKLDTIADVLIRGNGVDEAQWLFSEGKINLFSFAKQKVLARMIGKEF